MRSDHAALLTDAPATIDRDLAVRRPIAPTNSPAGRMTACLGACGLPARFEQRRATSAC
jgi:hypothetical protein